MQVIWHEIGTKIKYDLMIISPKMEIISFSQRCGTLWWFIPYLLKILE